MRFRQVSLTENRAGQRRVEDGSRDQENHWQTILRPVV